MDLNFIRAIIFLVAGLLVIFFPKQVFAFQVYLLKKLGLKHRLEFQQKSYFYLGAGFLAIATGLFLFAWFR